MLIVSRRVTSDSSIRIKAHDGNLAAGSEEGPLQIGSGENPMTNYHRASAYGGPGWSPRSTALRQEIGEVWGKCGINDEWSPLKAVLLHRPGSELEQTAGADAVQMLGTLRVRHAQEQHDALAQAYRDAGVAVRYVEPPDEAPPNLMFLADLLFMTPEGAVLGRPASKVRAGEERLVAVRLAELGIPILCSVRGHGTFEGADAAWIDTDTVLLATGLRTNPGGADQVARLLREMGIGVVRVGLPYGAMHLMGQLRFVDRDLAFAWPGRVPFAAVDTLRGMGYNVLFLPDEHEAVCGLSLNFVTMGPRRILMASGNPVTQAFFEDAGVSCRTVPVDELAKAAGGIGCLTGVLERGPGA
jgi:N-dimethylarginine dimethylaminohydrolase